MRILVIGQCTLHWGRMEFGNIGNYYIIEPFFRELNRVYPQAEIVTTFQMSDEFCDKERVMCLPMELYYGWIDGELSLAKREFDIANEFSLTGTLSARTQYIDEVLKSDLVIDFSGDIWGRNADFLGKDRFLVGLYKDRVAQLLGKKTVMLAGSPGPFNEDESLEFAKEVYRCFDIVTNREAVSRGILLEHGFDLSKTHDLACPAFMFEPAKKEIILPFFEKKLIMSNDKPTVGFILCGWNMLTPTFDKWPREDYEFTNFIELIEFIVKSFDVNICLMSHSNGFDLPPNFKLKHGRDFLFAEKLMSLIQKTEIKDSVFILDGVYSPAETKAIIGQFDMLISGRVHAAVAGLSQAVPTVIIDYGHEPKAHKLFGFAKVAGVENYVVKPDNVENMKNVTQKCWNKRNDVSEELRSRMKVIKELVEMNFNLLRKLD